MPGPLIELTGAALRGVADYLVARAGRRVEDLPSRVRLGCLLSEPQADIPHFRDFWSRSRMTAAAPPPVTNWREKAAVALSRMYCNDELGCCVVSGKAHSLGVWSANDLGPEQTVLATDAEIKEQYRTICGPGDNGCVITRVLDVMRTRGLVAGGVPYRIDGYVRVDNTDKLQTQVVQLLFGSNTIGINLPEEWTRTAVWDVTNSRTVGGHDVSPIDYDEVGVYVSSWGRVYLMTWAAWRSQAYIREYYAVLAPLWYNADNLSPYGVSTEELKAAMIQLGAGQTPPVPPPPGPGPGPEPPTPPPVSVPLFTLSFRSLVRAGASVHFTTPVDIQPGLYDFTPHADSTAARVTTTVDGP